MEKVVEKVVSGSSPGTFFGSKSIKNYKKCVPRSTLERTVRRVLHKRCPGTTSNHENDGLVCPKPSFSHFHVELQNNRKLCPMGTPLAPLGGALCVILSVWEGPGDRVEFGTKHQGLEA